MAQYLISHHPPSTVDLNLVSKLIHVEARVSQRHVMVEGLIKATIQEDDERT